MTYVILRDIIYTRGEAMKKKDIVRKTEKAGWTLIHGAKHDAFINEQARPGFKIPIPRSVDIDEYTARGILRDAGLK